MVKRFLRPVIIGAVVGALCCTLLLAVMAAIVASQDIPKAAITPMAIVAAAAGAFFGGFAAARHARLQIGSFATDQNEAYTSLYADKFISYSLLKGFYNGTLQQNFRHIQ